jgi:membrane protease YdiL (CAAX protease family)
LPWRCPSSPGFLRITVILAAISITLGGVVEELYFRGYLLPRINWLGGWSPVVNIVLFSLYHFWSPWENVVRLLALTPWIYATWRTRNIYLALFIHIFINAFSGISPILLVFQTK